MKKLLAIRCIVDKNHGYGHFSRCLAIADYFSKKKWNVVFLINQNKLLQNQLAKFNLKFSFIPKYETIELEGMFLKKFIHKNNVSCFVLDMREFSEKLSKILRNENCLIAVIDDSSVKNVYSDILLNGTHIKKFHKYNKFFRNSKLLLGTKYFLTKPNFYLNKKKISEIKFKKRYTVVISCGGSDIHNITWKIADPISNIRNVRLQVITGPLMTKNIPKNLKNSLQVIDSPQNIWKFFKKADLVICTSGSTLFELAIQGIPCINVAVAKHQIPYGKKFKKMGFGMYVGFWNKFDFSKFKILTEKILSDASYRKKMSISGRKIVDGKGLEKFEKIICNRID